jgi:hypothetical protein
MTHKQNHTKHTHKHTNKHSHPFLTACVHPPSEVWSGRGYSAVVQWTEKPPPTDHRGGEEAEDSGAGGGEGGQCTGREAAERWLCRGDCSAHDKSSDVCGHYFSTLVPIAL